MVPAEIACARAEELILASDGEVVHWTFDTCVPVPYEEAAPDEVVLDKVEEPVEVEPIDRLSVEEIDRVLDDFRVWLSGPRPEEPAERESAVDLATLVNAFTALRHEVNLQTKASRGQLEQLNQVVGEYRQLAKSSEEKDEAAQERAEQTAQERAEKAVDESLRPIFKAILDALDALSVAHREVTKLRALPPPPSRPPAVQAPAPSPPPAEEPKTPSREAWPLPPAPPEIVVRLPWWARWLGLGRRIEEELRPFHEWRVQYQAASERPIEPPPENAKPAVSYVEEAKAEPSDVEVEPSEFEGDASESVPNPQQAMVDSLLAGYAMSISRLERLLDQFGFEAIDCVGCRFDPELMEVLDVVREEGRTETEVIAELRRGYIRNDRVVRFAQVRVARP